MKLLAIYNIINAEIPFKLSDDYVGAFGGHDNSGIILDTGEEISCAVFTLDLSFGAIELAKRMGAKLIVTHHPAIFFPISDLRADNPSGKKLIECARAGISVISMHLNADCAPRGVDYWLAESVGAKEHENIPVQTISGGGYGRIFHVEKQAFSELSQNIITALGAHRVWQFGPEKNVERVAVFCGAGMDGDSIQIAKKGGADVIVSADAKHNYICEALDYGINVIQLTHYASENYGFNKIYQDLKDKLGVASEYHNDDFML